MITVLRWWLIFCLTLLGVYGLYTFGFFFYIAQIDKSYLSFVIITIFALGTIWVGQLSWTARNFNQAFRRHLPMCWFLSEVMMGLGMMGTLIGFLMLLNGALGQLTNPNDTSAMTTLISKMGIGFATSAITTIVGLACSLIFKLQLMNLEYQLEDNRPVLANKPISAKDIE